MKSTHVQYDVFEVAPDSSLCFLESRKNFKEFYIKLRTNKNYLIRFIAKNCKTKHILINAAAAGNYRVNVDFSIDGSVIFEYSKAEESYKLTRISNEPLLSTRIN